jgi:Raf kinase inhibitor-like YbhB/YbcL family protein
MTYLRDMRRVTPTALTILLALGIAACSSGPAQPVASPTGLATSLSPTPSPAPPGATAATPTPEVTLMTTTGPFTLSSDAFKEGGAIPREYTCQGTDISPALAWTGTPAGTAELVLVVDDPDAGGFVHWIVLVDVAVASLPRAISPTSRSLVQGENGFGDVGWGGPCPPSGTHHYRFTLTALGQASGLTGNPTIAQVRSALSKAAALGTTVLTGTYRKT